jgi:hypothetical protein
MWGFVESSLTCGYTRICTFYAEPVVASVMCELATTEAYIYVTLHYHRGMMMMLHIAVGVSLETALPFLLLPCFLLLPTTKKAR